MDTEQDGKYPYAGTAGAIVAMGSKHVNKEVHVSFSCDWFKSFTIRAIIYDTFCESLQILGTKWSESMLYDWNNSLEIYLCRMKNLES